jgi:hypothetical protein
MTDIGPQARPGAHRVRNLTLNGDVVYDVIYNFFGCSFTFGEGLNDGETLPHFAGRTLEGVTSKNFGFHQALAILQSKRDTSGNINFFLTAPWHAERSACLPEWSRGRTMTKTVSSTFI